LTAADASADIDGMAKPAERREGFVHKGRIVYALYYRLTDGTGVVTRLDSDGNTITGARPAEPGRRIVTTKPGDWIFVGAERKQVAAVRVFAALPVKPLQPSGQGPNFNPHARE
jgi:hypothetical protein